MKMSTGTEGQGRTAAFQDGALAGDGPSAIETYFVRTGSPLGTLLLVAGVDRDGPLLRGLYFDRAPHAKGVVPTGAREDAGVFGEILMQLEEYFEGERVTFALRLGPRGTPFQREVWRALSSIPYGDTTTYAELASSIGRPRAVRAVGAANGRNPLSIVVPCHRVIGQGGALTGYAGGVENKRILLELESRRARDAERARG